MTKPDEQPIIPGPTREPVRLIDCFMEMIGYTRYLLKQLNGGGPDFEDVRNHYATLITRSREKASRAKISSVEWKKACFPVCAWVDEVILCSEWVHKDRWRSHQLQLQHYNTTNAGEAFFDRLERLKPKDDGALLEVYLYCLSLGFAGRFYKEDHHLHLAEIKVETLLKLFSDDEAIGLPESLFPEGYVQRRAAKKRWKRGFSPLFYLCLVVPPALLVGVYLLFSTHLTHMLTDFRDALDGNRVTMKVPVAPSPVDPNQPD